MKVYDYEIDGSRHCREGVATEERNGLFDTFWGSGGSDRHKLTDTEQSSAVLQFDTDDYDELDRYQQGVAFEWEQYALTDRQVIPSQHGLQHRYFVRKGSVPDPDTQIKNAERDLKQAKEEARLAEHKVEWAKQHLIGLIASRSGRVLDPATRIAHEAFPNHNGGLRP